MIFGERLFVWGFVERLLLLFGKVVLLSMFLAIGVMFRCSQCNNWLSLKG